MCILIMSYSQKFLIILLLGEFKNCSKIYVNTTFRQSNDLKVDKQVIELDSKFSE